MNILEYISQPNWVIKLKKSKTREAYLIFQTILVQTPFLPDNSSLQQRAWHIINKIDTVPLCPVCGNNLKFQKSNTYSKYCSQKCTANSPETIERKRQTNIQKYGSEEAYRQASAKRLKDISIRKYGVENMFQSEVVKNKTKDTMIERYGVKHPSESDEISHKRKNTMIERYGVEHALQSDGSKKKFTETIMKKYGVEHALQSEGIQRKIKDEYLEMYGVEHHMQIPIPKESLLRLNDINWLTKTHHEDKKTLTHIADMLSVDKKTVSRYMTEHGIEIKYYGNSLPERDIVDFLNSHGVSVQTNVRNLIPPLELDIYLEEYKLAIEYCGLYWHSDLRKSKRYHQEKYQHCKEAGIRLITIFENEWIEKPDLIKKKLLHILHKKYTNTVYARNTSVVKVDSQEKKKFLELNHIQGNGPSSINYGLIFDNELVSVMGFAKQGDAYILSRYATSMVVTGGFSKLLKAFEKEYNYPEIVSFADLRWSEGSMYEQNNFVLENVIEPDYSWCKDKQLWHKFSWRHTGGLKKLPNYDDKLSEYVNMSMHGYYRIWDCGKLKYIKNKKGA